MLRRHSDYTVTGQRPTNVAVGISRIAEAVREEYDWSPLLLSIWRL